MMKISNPGRTVKTNNDPIIPTNDNAPTKRVRPTPVEIVRLEYVGETNLLVLVLGSSMSFLTNANTSGAT
jgi:hypothetical protein